MMMVITLRFERPARVELNGSPAEMLPAAMACTSSARVVKGGEKASQSEGMACNNLRRECRRLFYGRPSWR
jgi:hypothetical protein